MPLKHSWGILGGFFIGKNSMARKKKHAYRGGYIRPTEYGTFRAEIFLAGSQRRSSCKTVAEAEAYIDAMMLSMEGKFLPLTERELREAREAISLLPDGVGLVEVARQWCREHGHVAVPVVAATALKSMLREKASLGLRKRSLESITHHVERFLEDSPGILVHEITTAQIRDWLTGKGHRGGTWNNYRRDIHNFLGWCVTEKHISRNPCSDVPKARTSRTMPECFSVDQTRVFLSALMKQEPELVPYYATGFFAGIRSAELDRMTADCFTGDLIHIGPEQSKMSQQRYVTILPNLRAWLDAYPPTGALFKRNHRKRFTAVINAIKKEPDTKDFAWVDNGMRHSFASYHLAAFEDSAKTAIQLGHQNASLLYSTYRTLATKAEGERYFRISPKKVTRKEPET